MDYEETNQLFINYLHWATGKLQQNEFYNFTYLLSHIATKKVLDISQYSGHSGSEEKNPSKSKLA